MKVYVVVFLEGCVEMYLKVFKHEKDAKKAYNEFKKKYNMYNDFLNWYEMEVE